MQKLISYMGETVGCVLTIWVWNAITEKNLTSIITSSVLYAPHPPYHKIQHNIGEQMQEVPDLNILQDPDMDEEPTDSNNNNDDINILMTF